LVKIISSQYFFFQIKEKRKQKLNIFTHKAASACGIFAIYYGILTEKLLMDAIPKSYVLYIVGSIFGILSFLFSKTAIFQRLTFPLHYHTVFISLVGLLLAAVIFLRAVLFFSSF